MISARKKLLATLIFVSLFFLSSCKGSNSDTNIITIGVMSDTAAIPLIVAQEKGYFEDLDIVVNVQVFFSALDRDSALQANELDGVSSDIISAGLLHEAKSNIKIISRTESEYKIVTNDTTLNNDIKNFNNKTIGLSTNTLMEYLVDTSILEYNLTDVEKINIPKMPTRLEMLRNNQIDGAILPEPLASAAADSTKNVLLSNKDLNLYPGVLLFNVDFLNNNTQLMTKFIQSYNKAVDYINQQGTSEFKDILVAKLSFPDNNGIPELKYEYLTLPSDFDIQSAMDWLYSRDLITEKYQKSDLVIDIINN